MYKLTVEKIVRTLSVVTLLVLGASAALAQTDEVKVPAEIRPFIDKGKIAIALETGDLNADGRKDHVLVISEVVPEDAQWEEGAGARSVLILTRESNGSLALAARNDIVVYCKMCGGVFGDPFAGVTVAGTRFTINNYGGSNDRWSYTYTFAYSRRDNTWQLVRVEDESFHTLDPKRTMKRRIYTPPKNFGLISFADFDPDDFLKKGKK